MQEEHNAIKKEREREINVIHCVRNGRKARYKIGNSIKWKILKAFNILALPFLLLCISLSFRLEGNSQLNDLLSCRVSYVKFSFFFAYTKWLFLHDQFFYPHTFFVYFLFFPGEIYRNGEEETKENFVSDVKLFH